MKTLVMLSLCALPLWSQLVGAAASPYAGLETRQIKAMSADDIEGYRQGLGMSLALAAELNGYPGPRHVLDLSSELGLTNRQAIQMEGLFTEMQHQARALGKTLIGQESRLEHLFVSGRVTENALNAAVLAIADTKGRLRFVHLKYHLDTKVILSAQQLERYNELRGYHTQNESHAGHHMKH